MKNKIFALCTLLVICMLMELYAGNLYFRRANWGSYSAAASKINTKFILPLRGLFFEDGFSLKNIDEEGNPWVNYPKKEGVRVHPFIDYSHIILRVPGDPTYTGEIDYFGFRNNSDLYFDESRDYILIVMTGGSEMVGFSQRTSIAQNLEKILNSKVKNKKFKVMNLAMNSYTISNEINAYVHLAYKLKPEYVITHSGANDLTSSLQTPEKFKKLGLFYNKNIEKYWLPRLYSLASMVYVPNRNSEEFLVPPESYLSRKFFIVYKKGIEVVVDSYFQNIEKYKTIVESNQGKFMVGIQPSNLDLEREKPIFLTKFHNRGEVISLVEDMYSDLEEKARNKKFIVFNDKGKYEWADFIHSLDSSSLKVAKIYSDKILKDFLESSTN
jgi:hypothetical protein